MTATRTGMTAVRTIVLSCPASLPHATEMGGPGRVRAAQSSREQVNSQRAGEFLGVRDRDDDRHDDVPGAPEALTGRRVELHVDAGAAVRTQDEARAAAHDPAGAAERDGARASRAPVTAGE